MAIYHLSTKPISRSSGRSAVASVAYRAGIEIKDERLGKTYDYTKRNGVLGEVLLLPNHLRIDRAELWNMAEKAENRKDARTAREIVINIPHELTENGHKLAIKALGEFAHHLTERYGVAVDIAYHAPDQQGDNRNYHAHLLLTTRKIEINNGEITLGEKSELELSDRKLKELGKPRAKDELVNLRKAWADIANQNLERAGIAERIDHRSHKDRGLDTLPTVKMGWKATELERKGIKTEVGDQNRAIKAYNEQILAYKEKLNERLSNKTSENTLREPTASLKNKIDVTLHENKNIAENAIKEQIRALYKRANEIAQTLNTLIRERIQSFLESRKNEIFQEMKKISTEYNNLKADKPLFFGVEKWKNDLNKLLEKYSFLQRNLSFIESEKGFERIKTEVEIAIRDENKQYYDEFNDIHRKIAELEKAERTPAKHEIEKTIDTGKGR